MNKMSRQDVFDKIWNHFVVEGRPYGAAQSQTTKEIIPLSVDKNGPKSPFLLVCMDEVNSHVTKGFLEDLDSMYYKSFKFAFDGVNTKRVRTPYARRFQRLFRRTMKFFLINFAMRYSLTVDSEIPHTVHAKKAARRYKK